MVCRLQLGFIFICVTLFIFASACSSTDTVTTTDTDSRFAVVTEVVLSEEPNGYHFWVTIESPDIGCTQYADWWEVIKPDGSLVYRRILAHSHVDEQPFTRSGGPIAVAIDDEIFVRAHMNSNGYSEQVLRGSISQGFIPDTLDNFAEGLEMVNPLPDGCAF